MIGVESKSVFILVRVGAGNVEESKRMDSTVL